MNLQKQLLVIVLAAQVTFSCTSQKGTSDESQTEAETDSLSNDDRVNSTPDSAALIGLVKSQVRWKCDPNWKKLEKEEEKQFDEKGNLLKWIQYTSGREICEDFKYEYDDKRIMKEYRKNCAGNYDSGSITLYKYGINGRIEEEHLYESKKLSRISKFKFKSGTDRYPYLQEDYFDNEKAPTSVTNLLYDANGNLIEEEQLVSGSWFGTYTHKYNSRRQLIYQTNSVDGGVGEVEYFYIYENDLLVRDSVIIPDDEIRYHIYESTMRIK